MKTLMAALVVLVNVAAGGALYWATAPTGPRALVFEGRLEAESIELGFQIGGRIAQVHAREGQSVEKDELLAELDTQELKDHERNAYTRMLAAESQLPQLETQISLQSRTNAAAMQQARAGLAAAQAQSDEVRSGARPQEIQQARETLNQAQSRLENARTELARTKELYEVGSAPKKALDSAETAYAVAQADERRAREALDLIQAGARPESLRAATARVQEAEAGVRQAEASDLMVLKLQQQIATAKAEAQSARAAYDVAQTQVGYARLHSPIRGWVMSADARSGEVVGVGTKVFTLVNLDTLNVQLSVDEGALGQFRDGQLVTVAAEALPDREFAGRVSAIHFQSKMDQMQRAGRVMVQVENPEQLLKPGMRVRLTLAP
jgi:multidrug resistance efflux pump